MLMSDSTSACATETFYDLAMQMAKSAAVSQILNGLHANSMSEFDESSTHATETLVIPPQEGCN
jgi:hypothetical protein